MKKIAFIAKKGGVGKTTLALLFYQSLREAGVPVHLQDYDPQGSSSKALAMFDGDHHEDEPEVLIIDTPPSLSASATILAIEQATAIIVPCSPYPLDIFEAGETLEYARRKNPKATAKVVLNKVKAMTSFAKLAADSLTNIGVKPRDLLAVQISDRQTYPLATVAGWQVIDKRGREEILKFTNAISYL